MWYIVGLGNPGSKYSDTRHNVGWRVLDAYRQQAGLPAPVQSAALSGWVSEGVCKGEEVTVLYPDTYMNHSGAAVVKLVPKTASEQLIVVYDDIDIPFGEVKISFAKNSGGHNGVQSIIDALGTKSFVRVRVGIAPRRLLSGVVARPPTARQADFVLRPFSFRERVQLQPVLEQAAEAVQSVVTSGYERAMSRPAGQ